MERAWVHGSAAQPFLQATEQGPAEHGLEARSTRWPCSGSTAWPCKPHSKMHASKRTCSCLSMRIAPQPPCCTDPAAASCSALGLPALATWEGSLQRTQHGAGSGGYASQPALVVHCIREVCGHTTSAQPLPRTTPTSALRQPLPSRPSAQPRLTCPWPPGTPPPPSWPPPCSEPAEDRMTGPGQLLKGIGQKGGRVHMRGRALSNPAHPAQVHGCGRIPCKDTARPAALP